MKATAETVAPSLTRVETAQHASSGTLGAALLEAPIAPLELASLELSNGATIYTELVALRNFVAMRMRLLTRHELGKR